MARAAALLVIGLLVTVPAAAGQMSADEARIFVVDHLFSFSCFEGTTGEGRVYVDGSVSGAIHFGGGGGPMRYATLPAGTLRVRGQTVCAGIAGIPFEVCFDLDRTDTNSFRGSLAGMSFASCQFRKKATSPGMASTSSPLFNQPTVAHPGRR